MSQELFYEASSSYEFVQSYSYILVQIAFTLVKLWFRSGVGEWALVFIFLTIVQLFVLMCRLQFYLRMGWIN